MAKVAKVPQTDWTRGGMSIANTAIPLYQSNLTRMDEYLQDPTARQDMYLNKYFGADAAQNQDILRAYNRAMGNATANNYAATAGGLASTNQRMYDDQQRYYNDLINRVYSGNVTNAYNMSNMDYQNMLAANSAYNNAYGLGQNYSKIEQQNALADKANGNWLGQGLSSVGSVLSSILNPVTMGLGAAMQLGGNLATTDTSQAMAAVYGGNPSDYSNNNVYGDAFKNIGKSNMYDTFKTWWDKKKGSSEPQLFETSKEWLKEQRSSNPLIPKNLQQRYF